MPTGAITQYIDVAQLVLYAFWIFFAGLIFYLLRENKREGYPLEMEGNGRVIAEGFPSMPSPKTYLLRSGRVMMAPNPQREMATPNGVPFANHFGAPLEPIGNPMLAAIGPGAYAMRPDIPDLTATDKPRIVPLRADATMSIGPKDIDPRGLPVIGTDGAVGGVVRDLWVDRAEIMFRYIEVEVRGAADARTVLLPMNFARVKERGVMVDAITGAQFADVPRLKSDIQITMLEEERVMAYYGAGTLYATPARSEPLL
ncbi:MAG: photosynthetic reaction center subunit H [Burkholderiaceae bacterium]